MRSIGRWIVFIIGLWFMLWGCVSRNRGGFAPTAVFFFVGMLIVIFSRAYVPWLQRQRIRHGLRAKTEVMEKSTSSMGLGLGIGLALLGAIAVYIASLIAYHLGTVEPGQLNVLQYISNDTGTSGFRGFASFVLDCVLIGSFVLILTSYIVSLSPNRSRTTKYTFFTAGYGWLASAVVGMWSLSVILDTPPFRSDSGKEVLAVSFVLLVFIMLCLLLANLWFARWNRDTLGCDKRPGSVWHRRYLALHTLQWLFIVTVIFPPLFSMYLAARYHLGQRMRKHPIMFFRSFSLEPVASKFSNKALRQARKFGVVVTLWIERQLPEELQKNVNWFSQVTMTAVSYDKWEDWVRNELKRCAVVIIDASRRTDGVEAELRMIEKEVSASKVAILEVAGQDEEVIDGATVIRYGLSSQRQTAKQMRKWLNRTLIQAASG